MANRFATTSTMIIQPVTENDEELLLAIDASGLYLTTAAFVDKKIADPNRYSEARKSVPERLKALGLDPVAMFKDNQHMVKAEAAAARKLNPLKASKRSART